MTSDSLALLRKRQAGFDNFYAELPPSLVDFASRLGIEPSHEILNHATAFAPPIGAALRDLAVESGDDRVWLILQVGYYIGDYFVQKYSGHWFVNDIEGSRFFARYVVGKFTAPVLENAMIDPFDAAQDYVDTLPPRVLGDKLREIESELERSVGR